MSIIFQSALSFEINGIHYTIIDSSAIVVRPGNDENIKQVQYSWNYDFYSSMKWGTPYQGEIIIPETITYNDTTYSVKGISQYAFYECGNITSITLPNTLTDIGYSAFYGCYFPNTKKDTLRIPDSVKKIGDGAFCGTRYLECIILPEKLDTIPYECLASWHDNIISLEEVVMPKKVKYIAPYAFAEQTNLEKINIPDMVEEIDTYAFAYCRKLNTTLPNGVLKIGKCAFSYTYFPIDKLPDWLFHLKPYMFYDVKGKMEIELHKNMLYVPDHCFYGCANLLKIILPEKLDSIGDYAFAYCSKMTNPIFLGKNVQKIGKRAFYSCNSPAVYSLSKDPCILDEKTSTFSSYHNYASGLMEALYIPKGYKERYTEMGWTRQFKTVIEIEDEELTELYEAHLNGKVVGIKQAKENIVKEIGYYNIHGQQINKPQIGINIIKYNDGSTKKLIIKK